jgi:PhnB protein
MMKLAPDLFFDGQCEAAFTAYQRILGGRIEAMLRYEGSPVDIAPEWRSKIMHACLELDDGQMLMASDAPPEQSTGPMRSVHVSVTVKEPAEAERIFAALAEGGTVTMPMAETFWAPRFGMLGDRYGALWMIGCEPAAA